MAGACGMNVYMMRNGSGVQMEWYGHCLRTRWCDQDATTEFCDNLHELLKNGSMT